MSEGGRGERKESERERGSEGGKKELMIEKKEERKERGREAWSRVIVKTDTTLIQGALLLCI